MTWARTALCVLLVLACGALPAAAQDEPGTEEPESRPVGGSLTVLSRPPGASFQISGDRNVVGRTPLTLERVLEGRYKVRSLEPGFDRWQRTVVLDGTSADTLWMTLHPKRAIKAGLRCVILPGWGQFYSGRSTTGTLYLLGAIATSGGLLATHLIYEKRVDELEEAVGVAERRRAAERAEDAYDARQVAGIATGALWGFGAIDAVVFFPRNRTATLTVGLGGPAGVTGVRMQLRF